MSNLLGNGFISIEQFNKVDFTVIDRNWFIKEFPRGFPITEKNCIDYASQFDWEGVAAIVLTKFQYDIFLHTVNIINKEHDVHIEESSKNYNTEYEQLCYAFDIIASSTKTNREKERLTKKLIKSNEKLNALFADYQKKQLQIYNQRVAGSFAIIYNTVAREYIPTT